MFGKLSKRCYSEEGIFHGISYYSFNCFNPVQSSVVLLYPLKTSENPKVFWCFQGLKQWNTRLKWVNLFQGVNKSSHWLKHRFTDVLQNNSLKNFKKITVKHLCWSFFLINFWANCTEKRLRHRCFQKNFAKFLRTLFFRTSPPNCLQTEKSA